MARRDSYIKKYGPQYADAVLAAIGRASRLGKTNPGYPQAVAKLEEVKKEALEAKKTGMVHANSSLAEFLIEVAGTLVKDGYTVSRNPKDGGLTVSR